MSKLKKSLALAMGSLNALLIGLELYDWSWRKLRKSGHSELGLKQVAAAAREYADVMSRRLGGQLPLVGSLVLRQPFFWFILYLGPRVMPLDLKAYIKYHFLKVGDQMTGFADEAIEFAQKEDLSIPNFSLLYNALKRKRSSSSSSS